MSSPLASLVTVVLLCGGALLGTFLRDLLPSHHVRDDSKDIVKAASGIIATLVALVIGLLVSSAKSSFDQANSGITQAGAKMIQLDQVLRRYGPETEPIRVQVAASIRRTLDALWPAGGKTGEGLASIERGKGVDEVFSRIDQLDPQNDTQRTLKSQAIQAVKDVVDARWLMVEQAQNDLPTPLLLMLIFWLTVLFVSLGLLAPRNATTLICLFVCAVSMTGAILLLLELNRPYEGFIQASPAPLQKALALMGQS